MKEFWVDFSGYLKVKAETVEEVENKFWHFINEEVDLSHGDLFDDVWGIEDIEECIPKEAENDFWYSTNEEVVLEH